MIQKSDFGNPLSVKQAAAHLLPEKIFVIGRSSQPDRKKSYG